MRGPRAWEQAFDAAIEVYKYDEYINHIRAVAYLGIESRKDLLKVARCQRSLRANPFLKSRITSAKPTYTCPQDIYLLDRFATSTHTIVTELSDMVHKDVVGSAVISNLCRSAPLLNVSTTEIERNKVESWEKEILATTGPDRPQVLDYDVWFSEDPLAFKKPISRFVPPAPVHNSRIRMGLRRWRDRMSGKLLYPQFQPNKSISRATAANYTDFIHQGTAPMIDTSVSSCDLEKIYADSGVRVGGPCELRQAWKYNDLTPRTYFAQGGTSYHHSKYIRTPINELTNTFPEVNFQSRFSFHELTLDTTDDAFVYDYTSFTSLLAELKYFLAALADFTDTTEVFLVDSNQGILRTTLGSVLREYNEACNIRGEFTVNRYHDGDNIPLIHEVAGFLGVYGNIASSTTLHGLHACQICGDASRGRCVGDDVFGILGLAWNCTREDAIKAVESMGRIQRSKVRYWPYRRPEEEAPDCDRAYTYLKRPMDRFGNKMQLDQALFLPIWGRICPLPDDVQREKEPLRSRVRLLASQTYSTIRQCQSLYPRLELHQQDLLRVYLKSMYKHIGVDTKGRLPFETMFVDGEQIRGVFLPNIEEASFLEVDPWTLLEDRFEANRVMRVPEMVEERQDNSSDVLHNAGVPIVTTMSKTLSYLEAMGWARSEKRFVEVLWSFSEYARFYQLLFSGNLYSLYDVQLLASATTIPVVSDLATYYEAGCLVEMYD